MNKIHKHKVISKASSSQINDSDPIFYGYIYSEQGNGNQHKERFVDFKNLSHFNEHLSALGKDSHDHEDISIIDVLKRDFPSEKRVIIDRIPTPYPKQLKIKKSNRINKKVKKSTKPKNRKSKTKNRKSKSKKKTKRKHTKKKK